MTVELKDITKVYKKKKKTVLHDVNITIATGSFTIIKGASGSGKSTLLNIIGGLEPATSGKIIIDGKEVNKLKGKNRTEFYRHKIGFIFQGFYLQPQLTVSDNIALMGIFSGMPRMERKKHSERLAELLGISKVLDSFPAEISGGQAERACIARAIFMSPEIILADEPTNNLDLVNARKVIEILKVIQENTNTTIIIATHDPMIEAYADHVICISNGIAKVGRGM